LFEVGTAENNLLRFGLAIPAAALALISAWWLFQRHGPGIAIEIPMLAAQRWVNGAAAYLPQSFDAPPGPDLPFLYPPAVLPFVAPLLALPRAAVLLGAILVCGVAASWALWRLRIPPSVWVFVLAWPPFAEGIVGANVQVVLFALFVALFFRSDKQTAAYHPTPQDPAAPLLASETRRVAVSRDARNGVLATLIAAFKGSQAHAWAYLLFRRPRAAIVGLAIVAAVVLATLPFTGIGVWADWIAQVRRAADPSWALAGIAIGKHLPVVLALAISVGSIVALAFVPRAQAGAWVGVLAVIGAPSLHTFGLLFLVPAMLVIRREIALVAALFVAIYTEPGMWIGIALVVGSFVAGARVPALREPDVVRSPEPAVVAVPVAI